MACSLLATLACAAAALTSAADNATPSSSPGQCRADAAEGSCAAVAVPPDFTDALDAFGKRQWADFHRLPSGRGAGDVVRETIAYMGSVEGEMDARCRNKHALCAYYAANDECDELWSVENCAPVCGKCEALAAYLDGKWDGSGQYGDEEIDADEENEDHEENEDDDQDVDDEQDGQNDKDGEDEDEREYEDGEDALEDDEPDNVRKIPTEDESATTSSPGDTTRIEAESASPESEVALDAVPVNEDKTDEKPELVVTGYGVPQATSSEPNVRAHIEQTKEYMEEWADTACKNKNEECAFWAAADECNKNPRFMHIDCAPECRTCEKAVEAAGDDEEEEDDEPLDASPESFTTVTEFVLLPDEEPQEFPDEAQPAGGVYVTNDWGVPQHVAVDADSADEVFLQLAKTRKYMEQEVMKDDYYQHFWDKCTNKQRECAYWATLGECEREEHYMMTKCAPECQTCDSLPYDLRCQFTDEDQPKTWQPGDLNRMFERIVGDEEFVEKYGPLEILSSPSTTQGPWVITLDNFLSDEECDKFIEIGAGAGYERSYEVGAVNFDGTTNDVINPGRTSTNAWCNDRCHTDEVTEPVYPRILNMTQIPRDHWESVQLLNYQVGQKYWVHHDYIEIEHNRMGGPRIITVFMYLNNVEAGGGTDFPRLNLTVTPKRGRVVLWPSVLDGDPLVMDPRTHHQALPVEAGEKYGANAWLHLRNYSRASGRDC